MGSTVPVASAWALSSVWQLAQAKLPPADRAFSANKACATLKGVGSVVVEEDVVVVVDVVVVPPPQAVSATARETVAKTLAQTLNVKSIPLCNCE
jgi:hypothetical protein